MCNSFAHLHQHTTYSFLDGAAKVQELIEWVKKTGGSNPAVAMTDHGNMHGAVDFYRTAIKNQVKPIIGFEAYMAAGSRFEKGKEQAKLDGGYFHLTLLAKNFKGYQNLCKLNSLAWSEGFYRKPRCLLAGQEIVTKSGYKKIEEVEVGDEVLTHRGRFKKVINTTRNYVEEEIYGFSLSSKYPRVTWMTGEHPVLVRARSGQVNWVNAKDIVAGRANKSEQIKNWHNFVCLPKLSPEYTVSEIFVSDYVDWSLQSDQKTFVRYNSEQAEKVGTNFYKKFVNKIELTKDFGRFLGLYIAEGSTYKKKVNECVFSLHSEEKAVNFVINFAKTLTENSVHLHTKANESHRGIDVKISSSILAQLMSSLCGFGANNKRIPEFVFDASREFQKAVLDGILEGDGAIKEKVINFGQTSEMLVWQVRTLATSLYDCFPRVSKEVQDSARHSDRFWTTISLSETNKHTLSDNKYVYKPIKEKFVMDYSGYVYNIEVEEDHSYVSDFAMHNCDFEILKEYNEGIICMSGCLGAHIPRTLLDNGFKAGEDLFKQYLDVFGDRFFVELQNHNPGEAVVYDPKLEELVKEQGQLNQMLKTLAHKYGVGMAATNDGHYVKQEDAAAQEALLAIQTKTVLSNPDRWKFPCDQFYMKTPAEMAQAIPESEYEGAISNTNYIADMCNVELPIGDSRIYRMPSFPTEKKPIDELRDMGKRGLVKRYGALLSDHLDRLEHELKVIEDMGFPEYFLLVQDIIAWAKKQGIRVGPARGSVGGSLLAYAIEITDIDPIRFGLLFERFLNPNRVSLPDIDMDFQDDRRDEIIAYVADKYGHDKVANIATFSKMSSKAAIKDAARVMGVGYEEAEQLTKIIPSLFGKVYTIDKAMAEVKELKTLYNNGAKKYVDLAKQLEGLIRQVGVHAAGVIISNKPLIELVPTFVRDGVTVTQYDMDDLEDLGYVKMDFLGLRTLSFIQKTVDLIGEEPEMPYNDSKAMQILAEGKTSGIFQFESAGMTEALKRLEPKVVEDLFAITALYRPGPMENISTYIKRRRGEEPVSWSDFPTARKYLEPIIKDSQGILIFQEEIMQICSAVAGYSLAEADIMRRIIGKKKVDQMPAQRKKFIRGCSEKGIPQGEAEKLFGLIEKFANYSFNRCLTGDVMLAGVNEDVSVKDVEERLDNNEEVYLQSFNTDTGKMFIDECIDVIDTGVQEVFEVTFDNGRTVKCTMNHKFLCEDGKMHTVQEILELELSVCVC